MGRFALQSRLEAGISQEVRGLALDGFGDPQNVEKGDVAFASFNLAHVRSVNLGDIGQSFLGQRQCDTTCAYGVAEPHEVVVFVELY